MRGRYWAFCASVPQWMIVGPTRLRPMPGSTGACAAESSPSQTPRWTMGAPRPPYSLGHATPTQPALCIVFCHATRRSNISRLDATRSSTGSSTRRSAGRCAPRKARNSLRNASCSGAYSKSMGGLLHRLASPVERLRLARPLHRLASPVERLRLERPLHRLASPVERLRLAPPLPRLPSPVAPPPLPPPPHPLPSPPARRPRPPSPPH